MKRSILYVIVGIVVVVACAVGFILSREKYGTVKGKIVDALSGDPVWNVNIVLGGKSTTQYMSKTYQITGIKPGSYTFEATAPNYHSFSKEIKLKRGENILDVFMKGEKIPDLQGIIVFTESKEKGIQLEIRFTDSKGEGITKFPCLSLSLEGKLYVRLGTEEDYTRGKELFSGPIELFWDSEAFLAKNKGMISWEKIGEHLEIEKSGILDVVLYTPQGNFEDTVDDVKLYSEE